MKKPVTWVLLGLSALVLAGCGGGNTLTSAPSTSAPTPTPTSYKMSLLASSPQLPSDGSKSVTITALLLDSNNNVVSGVPVTFQSDSGALQITQATTGTDGTATATLSTGGDPSDRNIKITGAAGASTANVTVSVVGTKLALSGPSSLVTGSQATYNVTLTDSANNGIANQTVTVTSAKDNTINPSTLVTNSSGEASFTVTAVNGGTDTLTAAAGGLKATQTLAVSSDSFKFTSPAANQVIDLGATATVAVVWTAAGAPQAGQTVQFSATRGTLSASSAITDTNGAASVTISSDAAGPSVITASGNGVSAQVVVDFVATAPAAVSVQASPSNVPTQGQSTITATVRDVNNNLVEGQTVDFTLQDPTGGTLSVGSAKTNVQGQATTTYTASSTASATNGVVVTGTVQGTSVTGKTDLTVGGQTVFLSLGTGNTITALNSTQYEMPFTVQAIDASGTGVKGVTVSFTVTSLGYAKGYWSCPSGCSGWTQNISTGTGDPDLYELAGVPGCKSEDVNNTGIYSKSEDYNNNGKLDPGAVASTDVTSAVTDSNGTASVNLIYPKDHALWVAVRLTATATVNGTQSSTSTDFWLPILAADIQNAKSEPPGANSPYGLANLCSDPN